MYSYVNAPEIITKTQSMTNNNWGIQMINVFSIGIIQTVLY